MVLKSEWKEDSGLAAGSVKQMALLETVHVPKAPTEVLPEVVHVCLEWV